MKRTEPPQVRIEIVQAKLKQYYTSSSFDLHILSKNIMRILKCNVYVNVANLPDANHNKKPNQTLAI